MRVVIAEDQALLRTGLTRILVAGGFEVIAAVDNAADLRRALSDPAAELAVLDVRMPPTHTTEGIEAAVAIRKERPGFPVVVLSQYVEALYARELLADGRGAVGYLLKDRVSDVDTFLDSVRRVAAGATVLDPDVVAVLVGGTGQQHPVGQLTAREREVLELMAQGRSNAAIAARMFVTEKAVGKHTNNIFAKLGLPQAADDNRRVLAVLAFLESS